MLESSFNQVLLKLSIARPAVKGVAARSAIFAVFAAAAPSDAGGADLGRSGVASGRGTHRPRRGAGVVAAAGPAARQGRTRGPGRLSLGRALN